MVLLIVCMRCDVHANATHYYCYTYSLSLSLSDFHFLHVWYCANVCTLVKAYVMHACMRACMHASCIRTSSCSSGQYSYSCSSKARKLVTHARNLCLHIHRHACMQRASMLYLRIFYACQHASRFSHTPHTHECDTMHARAYVRNTQNIHTLTLTDRQTQTAFPPPFTHR